MNTYIIGDLQGCFNSLQALLKKCSFDPSKDRLGFVGDLVNRGPQSLDTLRFITELTNPIVVLGNHDLHLIALYYNIIKTNDNHTLDEILQAPDCKKLINWLLEQPLLYHDSRNRFVMTHAGIPPQWSIDKAESLAKEAHNVLKEDPKSYLEHMYGDTPETWTNDLTGWERLRYITNAFTRMRFCNHNGTLDLKNSSSQSNYPGFQPWFSWPRQDNIPLYFGHWAALEGKCDAPNIFALDTGCLWGGKLTAIRIEDQKLFSVNKSASDEPADSK